MFKGTDKQILLVTGKKCKHCEEAKRVAEKVAQDLKVTLTLFPVENLGVSTDIPVTCIIDRKHPNAPTCFVGIGKIGKYEDDLRKMLTET